VPQQAPKTKKRKVEKWTLQVENSPHLWSSSVLVLVFLVVIMAMATKRVMMMVTATMVGEGCR